MTFAKSPPGTTVGGWELMPHLKPVGDQSTNWIVRLVLMVATAAFTSFGTTSPRYIMQHAMYLPWRGSHFTMQQAGSKTLFVISATESCSWYAFSAEITGEYEVNMKWMRGYGTRLVWNSVMSTFSAPSKRSDAVSDEMHCATRRFRFVYVGRSMSRFRRQISYSASLSIITVTSVCSNKECTHKTVLYGSTTAVATCGQDHTVKLNFDFFSVIHRQSFQHQTSKT